MHVYEQLMPRRLACENYIIKKIIKKVSRIFFFFYLVGINESAIYSRILQLCLKSYILSKFLPVVTARYILLFLNNTTIIRSLCFQVHPFN